MHISMQLVTQLDPGTIKYWHSFKKKKNETHLVHKKEGAL